MKVLILGVNGFIGNALTRRILATTDWEVYGMDISAGKLGHSLGHPRFHFLEGDITINKEWIEYHVKKCDVVLPLVAIATPATYVKDPLRVFELDFEENLRIIRHCVKYKKRVIFPSTSEVYGMCPDGEFDEDAEPARLGPINKERWIYSCAKQLLDRVIDAYGQQEGLRYTLFRPFNWIGRKLDDISAAKEGTSRVLTQFIVDLSGASRSSWSTAAASGAASPSSRTASTPDDDHREPGRRLRRRDLQHRQPRQRVLDPGAGRAARWRSTPNAATTSLTMRRRGWRW